MKYPKVILLFLLMLPLLVVAQKRKTKQGSQYGGGKSKYRASSSTLKRNKTDVFPLDRTFRLGGLYAGLGVTKLFPMSSGSGESTLNDTTYSFEADPKGKFGLYVEAGWFHSFQNPSIFHYMDFGLAYKQFKGEETVNGGYTAQPDVSQSFAALHEFSEQIVSASFNLTNHRHFSRYGFITNSLGVNIDYTLSRKAEQQLDFPGYVSTFHEDYFAQLHYRLGVGWKASPTVLVIPSVELPFLNVYPFDSGKSSLEFYSSRHYPVIFSVRVMFLRPMNDDCNVPNYEGPSNF